MALVFGTSLDNEPDDIDPALLTDEEYAVYEAMLEVEWEMARYDRLPEESPDQGWCITDDLPPTYDLSDPDDVPF
jgi:hypothetical protein